MWHIVKTSNTPAAEELLQAFVVDKMRREIFPLRILLMFRYIIGRIESAEANAIQIEEKIYRCEQ
jgi:hypothetical protein